MDTTELKNLLNAVSQIIDAAQGVFPSQFDQKVIQFLEGLDDTALQTLAKLLNVPADTIKTNTANISDTLQKLETFFTNGNAAKLSALCKALSNRPVVLGIVARLL